MLTADNSNISLAINQFPSMIYFCWYLKNSKECPGRQADTDRLMEGRVERREARVLPWDFEHWRDSSQSAGPGGLQLRAFQGRSLPLSWEGHLQPPPPPLSFIPSSFTSSPSHFFLHFLLPPMCFVSRRQYVWWLRALTDPAAQFSCSLTQHKSSSLPVSASSHKREILIILAS